MHMYALLPFMEKVLEFFWVGIFWGAIFQGEFDEWEVSPGEFF